jgi:nucleoside recognition membrane protein YjiH
MTDFIYWLGDLFTSFFNLFEKLENLPNNAIIVLGFLMLFWWLGLQKKYNEKSEKEGSLK